jgi:hypothetical protein
MMTLTNKLTRGLAGLGLAGMIGLTGVAQATSSADDARSSGVWTVESGQWLGRIVAALESDPAKRARLMEEIVFLNPQAFVNSDPNRMRAGADLKLPGSSDLAQTPSAQTPSAPKDSDVQSSSETVTMAERIGRITVMRGRLTATGDDGATRTLRRRSYVRQGDTLSTSANGGAQVKFNDGAQIALRRDSSLKIDEYNWKGAEDGSEKAVMSLVKGGFRTITGAIGNTNKSNYRVSTPFATIGIRGTHYALFLDAIIESLVGGTAFGEIVVNDDLAIGPQQYFQADAQGVQALMGPPPNLFGGDTQVGDDPEEGDVASSDGDGGSSDEGGDSFGAEGGTETGGLIAGLSSNVPGQEDDGLFTEGEQIAVEESDSDSAFDFSQIDLTGDLSGLEPLLVEFYQSLGATNVKFSGNVAVGNESPYVAYLGTVLPDNGSFEADEVAVDGADGGFFITGDISGSSNVLLGLLGIDGDNSFDDLVFFSGPPAGNVLATKAVSKPAFSAYLGRWDANAINIFYEEEFDEVGTDATLATEFVFSYDRTPDSQLATLSNLGTQVFSSLHGFGSDELGQGFEIFSGDIFVDVDFGGEQITGAFMGVTDAQGRNWQFSNLIGGPLTLANDTRLELSGTCSTCNSGAPANAFIFTTFLGGNAEGVAGSFGAQTAPFSTDALEAIAGTWVGDRSGLGSL